MQQSPSPGRGRGCRSGLRSSWTGVRGRPGARLNACQADQLGYLHIQATRPQTLAYALHDSPAGQLAWIVEKFQAWTDPAAELPTDAVDRDQLLTGVSVYWFTGAGASSAHATYVGMQTWRQIQHHHRSGERP
jgi:epoxide hydrolase